VDISGFAMSQDDDLKPRVSWIGDGSMFCCSIVDPNKGDICYYSEEKIW
jgi:elongator complex protein 1